MPRQTLIQYRRGTAAQWASANPVLESGEPGLETDTGVLKIGDGTTAYASLPEYQNKARMLGSNGFLSRQGNVLQRLRDAGDGLAQAVDYRHRGTSGYVFHGVTEAGSGGFLAAYGTDEGGAGAVLRSHKNGSASEHAIGHGGSSILNYWQGYSASSLLYAEIFRGNQGLRVVAKNGQGYGDGVTTSGSTTFTSALATFSAGDVGRSISQTTSRGSVAPSGCIPAGTTIAAYVSPTEVTLSQAAGATGTSIPFLIGARPTDSTQQLLTFHDDNGSTVLGQIRKHGWDWYGTGSTSVAAVSMTTAGVFAARFGSSLSNTGNATQNGVTVTNQDTTGTGAHTIYARAGSGQTGDQINLQSSANAIQSRFDRNGVFMTRVATAPTDASMANGEVAIYFDPTSGAAKLKIKAKDAGGTVRTGEVALA